MAVSVQKIGPKGQVTLPKQVRDALGLKTGERSFGSEDRFDKLARLQTQSIPDLLREGSLAPPAW